jgi:uncharacterized membrane protein
MDINLLPWILFVHVLGAVAAFGPVFAFPLIGAAGSQEPMHAGFGLRLSKLISDRLVLPLAVLQGVTGVLLILLAGWDLTAPSGRWLLSAIVLYVIALGFATGVQRPNVHRLIDLMGAPRPADAPPGPPPGAPALIASIQRGGQLTVVLIVLIVALMVLKPSI